MSTTLFNAQALFKIIFCFKDNCVAFTLKVKVMAKLNDQLVQQAADTS